MEELQFTGLQIATFDQAQQTGNASTGDLTLNLRNVQAIGGADDVFTLRQTQGGGDQFSNGQFWELRAPDGSVVARQLNPGNDLYQGLGATDEYIIFQSNSFGNVIVSVNDFSETPTDVTFTQADEPGDTTQGDNDGQFDFDETTAPVCFGPGTQISTPEGLRRIERIGTGDLVLTQDNGQQRVIWKNSSFFDLQKADAEAAPVVIMRNALGEGRPSEDLTVSPNHRILVSGAAMQLQFGLDEAFVAAKHLVNGADIKHVTGRAFIRYHHIMFESHEILCANGLAAESFFPGDIAKSNLSAAAEQSLHRIRATNRTPALLARPEIKGQMARVLRDGYATLSAPKDNRNAPIKKAA
ncbi:Hint domain-containing protein [Roseivivax sp. THAF30]|uniref:Hint domain-containing protein n=1 Tax=Roseivivax sp. THAF30 TaxID=2587852 RepID=UPI0012A78CE4|nr:Hint domain-containing protein [Roseivivax sp. THAF30]QFT64403.1 hypothetical protein FIU91_15800 [Roseivivax sp. THAF30]